MGYFFKQFKHLLLIAALLLPVSVAFAQGGKKHKKSSVSREFKEFTTVTSEAGIAFTLPEGFSELKTPDNEDFNFNYAMTIPGQEFEVWLQVRSQKENYNTYVKAQEANGKPAENLDSLYIEIGKTNAVKLSGDDSYFVRSLSQRVLAGYNADAGKTFLCNIPDSEATKHYKYALLITLQKNKVGTILAVCLTNEKGPDFFKNINKARNCLVFK